MSHEKVLDDFGRLVEAEVEDLLKPVIDEASAYHPAIGRTYELAKEFVLRRGKRLASCSTLMVYKGYAGEIDRRTLRLASGIELYRHSILAHDDIVDEDELRRKGKTLHKAFEEGYDKRFGIGSTIFLGNILYSLSLQAILSSGFPADKLVEVLDLTTSGFRDVNESQILDLLFEYRFPDKDEWAVMARKRAASLFKVTMLMGATMAGAPQAELELLDEVARHIGYAFDIQDDIIDTFATEEQYGKKPCGDLIMGKKPFHIIVATERDGSMKKLLTEAQEDRRKTTDLQRIIRDSGALAKAKEVSKRHAEKAKEGIRRSKMNEEAKDFFLSFIDYVVESLEWYQ